MSARTRGAVGEHEVEHERLVDGQSRQAPPVRGYSVSLAPPWDVGDNVIHEFEFDLEVAREFFTNVECCGLCLSPPCWLCLPCYYSCLRQNNADIAYGTWVGMSRDNIYIVRKRRKSCCRCYCCDVGEVRKIIPVANVQDVMITEPAGTAVCCCVPFVLTTAEVQTAAAGGVFGGDKTGSPVGAVGCIKGLVDTKRFRDTVLELKRAQRGGDGLGTAATAPTQMGMPELQALVQCNERMEHTNQEILSALKSIDQKLDGKQLVPLSVASGPAYPHLGPP